MRQRHAGFWRMSAVALGMVAASWLGGVLRADGAPDAAKVTAKPDAKPPGEKADGVARSWVKEPKSSSPNDTLQPETVEALKALQKRVKAVVAKCQPCTVGIFIGASAGSGVFIRRDGKLYVLTAGHVSGEANKDCRLMLQDGRTISGKTLGANNEIDSGLIEVTDKDSKVDISTLPVAEVGDSDSLLKGQWVVSIGHPGGYQQGRTPVVRLGRIHERSKKVIRTDCTLVGGDSGGPLFDLEGRVIGIHSRIGPTLNMNFHVPVDTYPDTWDRLVKAEVWGGARNILNLFGGDNPAFMGVQTELKDGKVVIDMVVKDSPAEKAGLKKGDTLVKVGTTPLTSTEELPRLLRGKKPGDKVELEILRDAKTLKIEVVLAKRPQ